MSTTARSAMALDSVNRRLIAQGPMANEVHCLNITICPKNRRLL